MSSDDQSAGMSRETEMAMTAFVAMGLLYGMEMLFIICLTFKRWWGFYFSILIIANLSQLLLTVASAISLWGPAVPAMVLWTPAYVLTCLMHFLILYSRLHLLGGSARLTQWVLIAGVAEVVLVEIPLSAMNVIVSLNPDSPISNLAYHWSSAESVIFLVVDVGIVMAYLYHIKQNWGSDINPAWKRILWQLAFMSFVIILEDIFFLFFSFKNEDYIITGLQGFIYAFTLKIEMVTLNKLTELSQTKRLDAQVMRYSDTVAGSTVDFVTSALEPEPAPKIERRRSIPSF